MPEKVDLPGYRPVIKGNRRQIKRAAEAINAAERPVLYVGGGVIISGASDLLRQLAHKANIPVTTTLMGLGAFPEDHPLALKMLGMHGTAYANYAVQESDLLIAVGARFDDRDHRRGREVRAARQDHPHRHRPVRASRRTSASTSPSSATPATSSKGCWSTCRAADHAAWLEQIGEWKAKHPLVYKPRAA